PCAAARPARSSRRSSRILNLSTSAARTGGWRDRLASKGVIVTPASDMAKRIKPTLDTRFHIDYEWWERQGGDLRVYLISHLAPEQRELFVDNRDIEEVDWIDPVTAEVTRVDALQRAL